MNYFYKNILDNYLDIQYSYWNNVSLQPNKDCFHAEYP